jgi:hypothetical protein
MHMATPEQIKQWQEEERAQAIQEGINNVHRGEKRCNDLLAEIARLQEEYQFVVGVTNATESFLIQEMDPEDFNDEFGYYPEEPAMDPKLAEYLDLPSGCEG